jgi:hypothetical protein
MNPDLHRRLEELRADYADCCGEPFKHFFCPILAVDEESDLQKGHIVNEAFARSSRAWVVQRRDVDSFFGTHFEADFETIQYRDRKSTLEILSSPKIGRSFKLRILRNGKSILYTTRQGDLPKVFTPLLLEDQGKTVSIGIKLSTDEILATAGEKWQFDMFKDFRVSAFVTLIKSAHLTLFHMLGYRYAVSAAGTFVGHDILGQFYLNNLNSTRDVVQANARSYFRNFQHMMRPIVSSEVNFKGTVTDQVLFICVGTSGRRWGKIVFVKTAHLFHAVLIPVFDDVESVPTFLDFLSNDNEYINVETAQFDPKRKCWLANPNRTRICWPKTGILYPENDGPPHIE